LTDLAIFRQANNQVFLFKTCKFFSGQGTLLVLLKELEASFRQDIRAISKGLQTHSL